MKKNIGMIILAIVIIIIAAILIVWFAFPSPRRTNETIGTVVAGNEVKETTENVIENTQENVQENTQANEEIQTPVVEENTQSETTNTSSETFEESPETEEERAIAIARGDYGTAENVKFSVEGIQADGRYIVSVRDSSTTEALVYYTIDVAAGTFEKGEMN